MRLIFILVTVLGLAAALPTNNEDTNLNTILKMMRNYDTMSQFEELLLSILEGFRDTMQNGSDSIPVLDPFQLDHLSVDDSVIPLPGLRVTIEDVEVRDLSTFVIHSLSFAVESVMQQLFSLTIDLEIPAIEAEAGKYDLNVNALGFNIFGSGDLKIRVVQPRAKAYLLINFTLNDGFGLIARELDVAISLGGFQVQITGIFNDPASSEFVGKFLSNLVPELFEVFETEINGFVSDFLFDIIEDLLENLDIGGLLPTPADGRLRM